MMDKELLKHQFYDVMHKYKIPFTEKGVMENLEGWWYSKKDPVFAAKQAPQLG